jgi:hypothetical protein
VGIERVPVVALVGTYLALTTIHGPGGGFAASVMVEWGHQKWAVGNLLTSQEISKIFANWSR